jgi:hypothetical protein
MSTKIQRPRYQRSQHIVRKLVLDIEMVQVDGLADLAAPRIANERFRWKRDRPVDRSPRPRWRTPFTLSPARFPMNHCPPQHIRQAELEQPSSVFAIKRLVKRFGESVEELLVHDSEFLARYLAINTLDLGLPLLPQDFFGQGGDGHKFIFAGHGQVTRGVSLYYPVPSSDCLVAVDGAVVVLEVGPCACLVSAVGMRFGEDLAAFFPENLAVGEMDHSFAKEVFLDDPRSLEDAPCEVWFYDGAGWAWPDWI